MTAATVAIARIAARDGFVRAVAVSRPLFWLNSATLCVLATILSGARPGWRDVVLVVFATLPLNLFVYALNDLYDLRSDQANPRKGSAEGARAGAGELRALVRLAIALNAPFAMVFIATAPSPAAIVALAAIYLVAWAYSAPPLRLKSRPGWDSIANAGYALPLVFACLYLEVPAPPWRETLAFALWTIGAHAFTSVQDIAADRAGGVRTIATALGARASGGVAMALYLASALVLAGRHPEYAFVPLLHAALVGWMRRSGRSDAPHDAYRIFMVLNVATGFVITAVVALAHPATTLWAALTMILLCTATAAATLLARGAERHRPTRAARASAC